MQSLSPPTPRIAAALPATVRYALPTTTGEEPRDFPSRVVNKLYWALGWIHPACSDEDMLRWTVLDGLAGGATHLMSFHHSSEFMVGCSPWMPDESDIERQYDRMEMLFDLVASRCAAMTLAEFHAYWSRRRPSSD